MDRMIYQRDHKLYCAEFLNLPLNTFLWMCYDDYIKLSHDFNSFQNRASEWNDKTNGFIPNKIMGDIWKEYYDYCKENKIETELDKWLTYKSE